MKTFEFTLHFKLPPDRPEPKDWLDALYEAGCDDATVGVGRLGQIALVFAREAATARKAVSSAIADVERAIPKGAFIAADPDLVGLADIATLVGMTRQNLQKYATNAIKAPAIAFPPPVVLGSDAKWRQAELMPWLQQIKPGALTPEKASVSIATAEFNIKYQSQRLQRAAG
jgi:predicted DNA-binding transcriptional regulator AlpA